MMMMNTYFLLFCSIFCGVQTKKEKKVKRWEQFVQHQLSFVNFSVCLFWSTHSAGWVCFGKISIDSNRKMFCASYSEHDNDIREMVHVERICKRNEILFSTRIRIRKSLAKKWENMHGTHPLAHTRIAANCMWKSSKKRWWENEAENRHEKRWAIELLIVTGKKDSTKCFSQNIRTNKKCKYNIKRNKRLSSKTNATRDVHSMLAIRNIQMLSEKNQKKNIEQSEKIYNSQSDENIAQNRQTSIAWMKLWLSSKNQGKKLIPTKCSHTHSYENYRNTQNQQQIES